MVCYVLPHFAVLTCGESFGADFYVFFLEDPVNIPRPPALRSSRLWPERSSSLLPIPLPPPMLAPVDPMNSNSNIDVDLTVPSPALCRFDSPSPAIYRSDSTNESILTAPSPNPPSTSRPLSKDSHLTIDVGTASTLSLVPVQASEVQVKTPKTPELRAQIKEQMKARVEEMRGKLREEADGKDS